MPIVKADWSKRTLCSTCIEQYVCPLTSPKSMPRSLLLHYCAVLVAIYWFLGTAGCTSLLEATLPGSLAVLAATSLSDPISYENTPGRSNSLVVARSITGAGFHRTLEQNVTVTSSKAAGGCQLATVQHLPSSVFVDPYQLEDLSRKESELSFQLVGPLDLEL